MFSEFLAHEVLLLNRLQVSTMKRAKILRVRSDEMRFLDRRPKRSA
jgi:hypothetical protein